MDIKDLFTMALGLESPWQVVKIDFSAQDNQLDLHLDFPRGGKFACPRCKFAGCGVYDTEDRTWRHLNFFQHTTLLHARLPRIECPEHGVVTVEVPWARPGMGFTALLEVFILVLSQNGMTANQISRLLDEHDTRIWRVLNHYVEEALKKADYSGVKAVGVDETARARGHDYITVFADLDERKVLDVQEGRGSETIGKFKGVLETHNGGPENIEDICMDMSPAYISGVHEQFPEAKITFDQFHLMKLANEAVDTVRRQEQQDYPVLKGSRYVWLKNEWNHTASQAEIFENLRNMKLKTVRCHHIKSVFQDVLGMPSRDEAEPMLKSWYNWAIRSRLEPMKDFARMIKRHWDGVLRWFTSRISNGMLEGINSLIQSAKTQARGFRSFRFFRIVIFLRAGKLDLQGDKCYATHTK